MAKNYIIIGAMCFVLGAVCAGVFGYIRQSGQIAKLDTERAQLQREYEAGQRELASRLEYSQRTLDGAREIAERTANKLQQSADNLRSASDIIGTVYLQVKALEDWLNNRAAGGGGSGITGGVTAE